MKTDFKKFKNLISNWINGLREKDFSKIDIKTFKKSMRITGFVLILIILFSFFEIYIPLNPGSQESVVYTIQKGWGNGEIARDLKSQNLIRSSFFFQFYTILSFNHTELQAGKYEISPGMSIYKIVKKMASGDTKKDRFVIYEGWTVADIGEYLKSRELCTQEEFSIVTEKNYELQYEFLATKPSDVGLEGYLFPDTYEIHEGQTCAEIIEAMLDNFQTKLTPEIQTEIQSQNKTLFEVITMASLLEKEVRTLEDKKIVSGILWKRLDAGMPLQLDSTVNYVTGKSDASVSIADTKTDSLYNTYMYAGLPKGPISNPGIDSIIAAIEPTQTDYWYYLSDGKTHYAKTLQEHAANKVKYLR